LTKEGGTQNVDRGNGFRSLKACFRSVASNRRCMQNDNRRLSFFSD